MYPTPTAALELPGKNEERTYQINTTTLPDKIRVYPILTGGKLCESYEELNVIQPCS
jgi:hypothetical protein